MYEQSKTVARASGHTIRYRDPMHPAYTSDRPGIAPDCGMPLVPYRTDEAPSAAARPGFGGPAPHVSPEQRQVLGVRLVQAAKSSGVHRFRTLGRVVVDDTRVYRVSTGSDGWIRSIYPVATGSLVRKDQSLAAFYSRDFIAAQQSFFYALASQDREAKTASTPEQHAIIQAQVRQARETLESLGMGATQLEDIARTREEAKEIVLRSPVTGLLLARNAMVNQRFEKYTELYRIGDLSRVWIIADLYEQEARFVKKGQTASISVPAAGRTLTAKVGDLVPQSELSEQTLKLRLEAANPEFALRPDMVVDVELGAPVPPGVSVPAEAVLDNGRRKIVFVGRGDGYFEPRQVETGLRFDDLVQITRGLQAGESVALGANFLLDSDTTLWLGQ